MQILYMLLFFCLSISVFAQPHSGHEEKASTDEPRVEIKVPASQQTKIGLKTTIAEKNDVAYTIRTVGIVTADQTKEAHVHTKVNGWIEKVYADYVGKPIKKGQPLFDLYSPDLVATQEEYIAALKQGASVQEIATTARERLEYWGVPQAQINKLKKSGKSNKYVTFNSPTNGYIVEKMAVQGMYVTPEMELYRITDFSHLWIIATLYEYDVAIIALDDMVTISMPYDLNKSFTGKISYIYPEIDQETRTAKARIEINNENQQLKPGMFANIEIKKNLGEAIVIPDDAVIDTGTQNIVFIRKENLYFEPRIVKIGPRVENKFIILSGLKEGEEVVTSAHFLIDAESKFQAAVQKGAPAPQKGHGEHNKQ